MWKIAILATIASLLGCAAQPIERASVPAQGRIGIVNLVGDEVTHTHVGTTAFNNFKKEYSVAWSPASFLHEATVEKINASQSLSVVDLEPTPALRAYDGDFQTPTWSSFKLDESIAAELQSIAEQGDVDLLIILREGVGFAPDSSDTFKKADNGRKECSCPSEENSVQSSSRVRSSRRSSLASVVPRWPESWELAPIS